MGSRRSTCLLIVIRTPVSSQKKSCSQPRSYRAADPLWEEGGDENLLGFRLFVGAGGLGAAVRLLLVGVHDSLDRGDDLAFTRLHHADPLSQAPGASDAVRGRPDDGARRRDQHDALTGSHDESTGQLAPG